MPGYKGLSCKKERTTDGKHLYSFRDSHRATEEEDTWLEKHEAYDPSELTELRKEFGSISFISDLDLEPITAYKAYEERWNIEIMFRFYKDISDFDETRVHDDWSVVGTEFINFLSIVMTCKLRKAFEKVPQLQKVPYNHILRKLRRATMNKESSEGEWLLRKLTSNEKEILIELGLLPKIINIKNPVGRPKKERTSRRSV